jgi:hypothetical protein
MACMIMAGLLFLLELGGTGKSAVLSGTQGVAHV